MRSTECFSSRSIEAFAGVTVFIHIPTYTWEVEPWFFLVIKRQALFSSPRSASVNSFILLVILVLLVKLLASLSVCHCEGVSVPAAHPDDS